MSKKLILKNVLGLAVLSMLIVPAFIFSHAPVAVAQTTGSVDVWGDEIAGEAFAHDKLTEIGLGKKDPREIARNIIQILLGLLGIIAVVIILVGGFKWMTASGNEDKVTEAKKLLGAGIIGLLIVLAAWALAMFIISRFLLSTGAEFDRGIYTP